MLIQSTRQTKSNAAMELQMILRKQIQQMLAELRSDNCFGLVPGTRIFQAPRGAALSARAIG
jgi:hypothetical protein